MDKASSSWFEEGEASVETETGKPGSTDELMKMINEAGTELTVKYITGELTFEQFTAEVEKRAKTKGKSKTTTSKTATQSKTKTSPSKASTEPSSTKSRPSTSAMAEQASDVPGFDQLMREEDSDEEEEEDEDDPKDQSAVMEQEEEEDDYEDVGAIDEGSEEEWLPDKDDKKKLEPKDKKRKSSPASKEEEKPQKRKYKKRRKPWDTPKHLKGAQGRAMLLKAQGHTEEAIEMLYDIIKKAPKAAAAYQALGTIQEEMGHNHQGLKFLMVAANLRRAEPHDWFELRDMCMKLNEPKLAFTCFYRAMKYAKTREEKLTISKARTEFYEQEGQHIKALQSREVALAYMNKEDPDPILEEARQLVKEFMRYEDLISNAISTLQFVHREFPQKIDAEDIHLLVELLMSQQNYQASLEILVQHCGVTMTISDQVCKIDHFSSLSELASGTATLDSLHVPSLMPLDLRSKLVQSLIMLKVLPSLDKLKTEINILTQEEVEDYGDIHYDLVEAMMEAGYRENAKPILQALVKSSKFDKAEVWLTYGNCLNALGEIHPATEAYGKVIELAPNHYGARVLVASLQQQMGNSEKALEVLSNGGDEENVSDQFLLLHKCNLLYAHGRKFDFVEAARRLLFKSTPPDFNYVTALVMTRSLRYRSKFMQGVHKMTQKGDGENTEVRELEKREQKKFNDDLWHIYQKLYQTLRELGRDKQLLETAMLGVTCRAFCEDLNKFKEAEFMCLKVGKVNKAVYQLAKNLVVEEPENNQSWNLYSCVMTRYKDISDQRFIFRALMKNPNSMALCLMNGNIRLISGTYKQALAEYLSVFRQSPDNALAMLGCALSLLHITTQSFVAQRNALIPQVLSLLNIYKEMRGECQETYYNFGRAMYQLNLPYAAINLYKKALSFPPVVSDKDGTFDLSMDIAHNLAGSYLRVGNVAAARHYIQTYCVV